MNSIKLTLAATVAFAGLFATHVGCQREELKPKSADQSGVETKSSPAGIPAPTVDKTVADDQGPPSPEAALAKVEELKEQFEDRLDQFRKKFQAASTEEKVKLRSEMPRPEVFVEKFQKLAEIDPKSEASAQSWTWIVQHLRDGDAFDSAMDSLLEHHPNYSELKPVIMGMQYQPPSAGTSERFDKMLAKCTEHDLCGVVQYAQLQYRKRGTEIKKSLTTDEESAQRYLQAFGQKQLDYLRSFPELSEEDLLTGLEKLSANFGDVILAGERTIGSIVEGDLFEAKFLTIGKEAPDIEGEDVDGTAFKLSDYRGKIVMLDFWGDW